MPLPKLLEQAENEQLACLNIGALQKLNEDRWLRLVERIRAAGGFVSPKIGLSVRAAGEPGRNLRASTARGLPKFAPFSVERGVIATGQIGANDLLVKLPTSMVITPELFTEIPGHNNTFIDDNIYKLIFGLAYQLELGNLSRFVEYFALLPTLTSFTEHPVYIYLYSKNRETTYNEWAEIHPSGAKLIKNKAMHIIKSIEEIRALNTQFNLVSPDILGPENITLLHMWITTRSWLGNVISPIIDFCNHCTAETNTLNLPEKDSNTLVLEAHHEIGAGFPININYGLNDCNIIYSSFGFIEDENMAAQPGQFEARFASQRARTLTVFKTQIASSTPSEMFIKKEIELLSDSGYYPGILIGDRDIYIGTLMYLRLVNCSEDDIKIIHNIAEEIGEYSPDCVVSRPISMDNECRTLRLLMQALKKMEENLPPEKVKNARILLTKRAPNSVEYKLAALALISAQIQAKTKQNILTFWQNYLICE